MGIVYTNYSLDVYELKILVYNKQLRVDREYLYIIIDVHLKHVFLKPPYSVTFDG